MRNSLKVFFAVLVLSTITLGIALREPLLYDTETPSGYAPAKSIALLKVEQERAYAKALTELENEQAAKVVGPVQLAQLSAPKTVAVKSPVKLARVAKSRSRSRISRGVAGKRLSGTKLVSHKVRSERKNLKSVL